MWKLPLDTLSSKTFLKFYKIMKYPVPKNAEYFLQYSDNVTTQKLKTNTPLKENSFSRNEKCEYMDEYIEEINSLGRIFKSIPFVEEIYLCNSITFNALDNNSDIDLFIITKPWKIRTVKFRSMLLFTLKWKKRFRKNIRKKVCLSFFITSDNKNLYPISLPSMDIYLAYRISHLVLIYSSTSKINNKIFSENKRVKWILPNYQESQVISLWLPVFSWSTKFKSLLEWIGNWLLWRFFECIVKIIQKSLINIKRSIHPELNKDVIISDSMLKFHKDIREKIAIKYSINTK